METFKAGEYVVFLTYNGKKVGIPNAIPTDYVYQLREDFNEQNFLVTKDTIGSLSNGYSNKLPKVLRRATNEEMLAYIKADKPVPAIPELEMIPGETYYCENGYKYLFILQKIEDTTIGQKIYTRQRIYLNGNRYAKDGTYLTLLSDAKILRLATPGEKAHLEACIKANTYVDKSVILETNEPKFVNGKNYKIQSNYTYLYNRSSGKYLNISGDTRSLYDTKGGFDHDDYKIVPITPEEEAHLEACIAAGKYVDPPKKETLLEEANRRFPIGSKFKCNLGGFKGENKIYIRRDVLIESPTGSIAGIHEGYVYYKGEWAEIIEEPKSTTFNFIEGKYYKCNLIGEERVFYFRFKSLHGDSFFVSESRPNYGKWGKSNGVDWLLSDNENFEEVSEAEAKGLINFETGEIALPGVGGTCVLGAESHYVPMELKDKAYLIESCKVEVSFMHKDGSIHNYPMTTKECYPSNLIDPGLPKILPEIIETNNIVLLNNSKIKINGN